MSCRRRTYSGSGGNNIGIEADFIIRISKSESDPAKMITVDGDPEPLLNGFRRCLAKSTEDNKINICYLDDSNSNYYDDGATATLTGSEGDVMVYFPEFWYKGTDTDSEWVFNITTTQVNNDNYESQGWHHAPAQLVGAYKGYAYSNKLYSISGVDSTGYVSMINSSIYARNRGNGYHIIDYQEHCIIAWMFYARYKNTNSQAICGTGKSAYTRLNCGSTNSLGMTDTTTSNATSYSNLHVNFLGIEGCWGYKYEWIEGIHSHLGDGKVNVYDKGDFHDKPFSSITSDTKRQFDELNNSGYIKEIYAGDYMDMLPSNASGSNSAYYFCDYGYSISSSSCVFRRSCYYDYADGGVACLYGGSTQFNPYDYVSSRLAFDGEITIIDSSSAFKAITGFR